MPSLDDVYEAYCSLASELLRWPASSARGQELQQKTDQQWLDYLDQGGGREPWHTPKVEWAYKDSFQEMRHSSYGDIVKQLRTLLKLPNDLAPYYMAAEEMAVENFQANHNLPATGVLDRCTWQVIIAEKGERKAAILPRTFELPGTMTTPVPLVIRMRRRWSLALDDVPERTFANQHNLAVLADYAYRDPDIVKRELADEWNKDRLREDVILRDGAERTRVFVRDASPSFKQDFKFIEDARTDTQVFLLNSPLYTVIAFRGTQPSPESLRTRSQDVLTDGDAVGVPWMYDGTFEGSKAAGLRGFKVHRGFAQAFESVREAVRDQLGRYLRNNTRKPIFITGHSLGAALSCLCACYLRSHPQFSRHPIRLYNFAQPRVGTVDFCRHYWQPDPNFSYYRTANFLDPVTMVPSPYVADTVADGADVLIEAIPRITPSVHFVLEEILAWQAKDWARKRFREMCPPDLDYRHFGNLVLCGVNFQHQPFLAEIGKGLPREVEHPGNVKLQALKLDSMGDSLWHSMTHYQGFLLRAFEKYGRYYLNGKQAELPFSGRPNLDPMDAQLFHRFVHDSGVPAYHSLDEYRRALQ